MTLIGIILLATISSMLVGMLWYSPFLFGKQWAREVALVESSKKTTYILLAVQLFFEAITALGLLLIIGATGISPFFITSMIWLSIVLPFITSTALYERKSFRYILIVTVHRLVSLLVIAAVFQFV